MNQKPFFDQTVIAKTLKESKQQKLGAKILLVIGIVLALGAGFAQHATLFLIGMGLVIVSGIMHHHSKQMQMAAEKEQAYNTEVQQNC